MERLKQLGNTQYRRAKRLLEMDPFNIPDSNCIGAIVYILGLEHDFKFIDPAIFPIGEFQQIPQEEARLGDILYNDNFPFFHGAIYLGEGKIIHEPGIQKQVRVDEIAWFKRVYGLETGDKGLNFHRLEEFPQIEPRYTRNNLVCQVTLYEAMVDAHQEKEFDYTDATTQDLNFVKERVEKMERLGLTHIINANSGFLWSTEQRQAFEEGHPDFRPAIQFSHYGHGMLVFRRVGVKDVESIEEYQEERTRLEEEIPGYDKNIAMISDRYYDGFPISKKNIIGLSRRDLRQEPAITFL